MSDCAMCRSALSGGSSLFPTRRLPEPGGEINQAENGNYVIKYTCGIALLELHLALTLGLPTTAVAAWLP